MVPVSVLDAVLVFWLASLETAGSVLFPGGALPSVLGISGSAGSSDSASALGFGFDCFRDPMGQTKPYVHRLVLSVNAFGNSSHSIAERAHGLCC